MTGYLICLELVDFLGDGLDGYADRAVLRHILTLSELGTAIRFLLIPSGCFGV